jgi:hypothetical protein
MDKYEKQISEDKTKKSIKIPPMMKLEFYMNIEKLLWISDYPLYHAYSTILIKELSVKANKWIKLAKNVDKQNEAKSKLEKYDIQNINNKILLDALVTPYKNNYTNFIQVGNELLDSDKEIETQTCARMMNILKLNVVPSRTNLFSLIESLNILEDESCDKNIKELYYLLSTEKNPMNISKKGANLIAYLKSNPKFEKYVELISNNLIVKSLILMSQNYDSISFTRLEKIFPWTERFVIEEIISENSRYGILKCTVDQMNNLVNLKSEQGVLNSFNDNFNYFVNQVSKIACNIIKTKSENVLKISNIKDTLYKEIHSFNTNSLGTYSTLIQNMEHTNKKLDVYLKEKDSYKEELKETQAKKRKEEKQKAEEESRMMKELLKDEQKKKEFEAQLKKYLIERIKIYTNVLFFDGKKVKLDDLLKDLSKVSDEQLIKLLEKEEFEFKTKKEKKFKQIQKDTDYLIREYRKRDYEVTMKNLIEEEKVYNEQLEADEKKSYEQKIGSKSIILKFKKYKDNYFNDIQQFREQDYSQKLSEFTQSLNKKVQEDLKKDIGTTFKIWIEDFRKKQEEDALKSNFNKPQFNSFMKKGDKFKADDSKPKTNITSGLTDFKSIFIF